MAGVLWPGWMIWMGLGWIDSDLAAVGTPAAGELFARWQFSDFVAFWLSAATRKRGVRAGFGRARRR